jgi:hypothetical protein
MREAQTNESFDEGCTQETLAVLAGFYFGISAQQQSECGGVYPPAFASSNAGDWPNAENAETDHPWRFDMLLAYHSSRVVIARVDRDYKTDRLGLCKATPHWTSPSSGLYLPSLSSAFYLIHHPIMPLPRPHPLALFSLVPKPGNERAERIVAHPDNNHLVSTLSNGKLALDVGFHISGKSSKTLAKLGRGIEADIYVEGSSIAKTQCSFEIDIDTGVVMFCDRSFAKSTQVFGENATPFEHERIRQVLVQHKLNTIIGMGGERRDLIQFELEWHQDPKQTAESIKHYEALPCGRVENPRLARTIDEAPTNLPTRRETRPRTPGSLLKMRYVKCNELGSGQYGVVHKAIDVDLGKFMAVKIMRRPTRISKPEDWAISALKREVKTLSEISHVSSVSSIS